MFSMRTDRWSSPRPETLNASVVSVSSTLRLTSVFSSLKSLSRRCLDVTNLPSLPARGESFTMNVMAMVGSDIFWKGIGSGFSGEQRVSPICTSAIPDTATIEPICASLTSILLRPSYSKSFPIRTFSSLSGSCSFTMTRSSFTLRTPLSTLPTPIRPTYSL